MHEDIYAVLDALHWSSDEAPPVVDYPLFFEGNREEQSIAPNQWGEGRPPIADIHARICAISSRPDVRRVLISLQTDWNEPVFRESFPTAEHVHIFTSAPLADVCAWVEGLHCDSVVEGWPHGRPGNAPEPAFGYSVYSLCWD
jgi:hypothetical protein